MEITTLTTLTGSSTSPIYIFSEWGMPVNLVNPVKVRLILTKSSFNPHSGKFFYHVFSEKILNGYLSFSFRVLNPQTLAILLEGEGFA